MRIALISDIHIEFIRDEGKLVHDIYIGEQSIDVLILAGDIDLEGYGAHYAVRQSELLKVPVIYLAGNHEFYAGKWTETIETLEKITAGTNVHFLNRDSVEINGARFIGCTLWSDLRLFGNERFHEALVTIQDGVNDYHQIKRDDSVSAPGKLRFISPEHTIAEFDKNLAFITKELEQDFDGKTFVVTHHAPSLACLPLSGQNNLISAAYASNLDELIIKYKPKAWFHGHIHSGKSHRIGETLVGSWPRGYPQLQNSPTLGFKPMIFVI